MARGRNSGAQIINRPEQSRNYCAQGNKVAGYRQCHKLVHVDRHYPPQQRMRESRQLAHSPTRIPNGTEGGAALAYGAAGRIRKLRTTSQLLSSFTITAYADPILCLFRSHSFRELRLLAKLPKWNQAHRPSCRSPARH